MRRISRLELLYYLGLEVKPKFLTNWWDQELRSILFEAGLHSMITIEEAFKDPFKKAILMSGLVDRIIKYE